MTFKKTPVKTHKQYRYWYQEQERQTDLDLNWDSFKYRNYDYAIGRFMSVDPLAEKFPFQSHYVFSTNRVNDARELEGLEAVAINYDVRAGYGIVLIGGRGIIMDKRGQMKSFEYSGAGGIGLGGATDINVAYYSGTANNFSGTSINFGGKIVIEGLGGGLYGSYSPESKKWGVGGNYNAGFFVSVGIDVTDVTIKDNVDISSFASSMPKNMAISFLKISIGIQNEFLIKNVQEKNELQNKIEQLTSQLSNNLTEEKRNEINNKISELKGKISDLTESINNNISTIQNLYSALQETYKRPDFVMPIEVFTSPIHYDVKN